MAFRDRNPTKQSFLAIPGFKVTVLLLKEDFPAKLTALQQLHHMLPKKRPQKSHSCGHAHSHNLVL